MQHGSQLDLSCMSISPYTDLAYPCVVEQVPGAHRALIRPVGGALRDLLQLLARLEHHGAPQASPSALTAPGSGAGGLA